MEEFLQEDTEILVLPNITSLYLDGQLKNWEAEELFQETWEKILKVKDEYNLKVLVSVTEEESRMNHLVAGESDNWISVEKTGQGWKYDSDDFDQFMYSKDGMVQTTLSYWRRQTSTKIAASRKK